MARTDVLFVAMCVGTIAFVVGLLLPYFTAQAVAWYYPVERRWAYEVKPHGLAMDFYGRVGLGLAAGSLAVIISTFVTRSAFMTRRWQRLSDRMRGLWLAWTFTAVVFAMAYFAWTLAHHVPEAQPIPAWYTPR